MRFIMAKVPTPEDLAREVLDIFKEKGERAGNVMQSNILSQTWFAASDKVNEDLNIGLGYALDAGWLEETQDGLGYMLTDLGFAET